MRAGRKAAAAATAAAGLGLGISMVVVVVVVYLGSRIRQAALLVNLTQIVCNTSCSSEVFAGGQRREAARAGREEEGAAGWLGGEQRAVALKVPTAVAAIKFSRGGCVLV